MKLDVVFQSLENDFDIEFKDDNNFTTDLESYIESKTSYHNELINRDLPDQHPISAITGLQEALNSVPSVLCDTTDNWNAHIDYVAPKGAIVVYTDYATINDEPVPNIKISDGLAYLIDQPFVSDDMREELLRHINDTTVHITAAERAKWNSKVSCSVSQIAEDEYLLTFVTG